AALQAVLDGPDGSDVTRVVGAHEAELGQQQQAGVEFPAADGRDEDAELPVPAMLVDERMNALGFVTPRARALDERQPFGDPGQSIAGRPAHHARERVYARAVAQFP